MNTIDRFAINPVAAAGAGAIGVRQKRPPVRRTRLQDSIHARLWLGVLAALAIVWLLLAFHDVARAAVQQGELRRKAAAEQADAAWRFKSAKALLVGNRLRVDTAWQDSPPKF